MPTRRSFFSAVAFGAAAFWPATGFARRRRSRRSGNVAASAQSPTTFSRGAFPTGYQYGDSTVELIVPNLTQWAKLQVGMTPDDVLRILGRPLEGEATIEPDYLDPQLVQQFVEQGDTLEEAKAALRGFDEIHLQAGHISIASWIYGWVKLGDGDLFWQRFNISFANQKVLGFSDPFGGGWSISGQPVETQLSHDGRPTAPRLLTPNDNAQFTHTPLLVDFRWLPSCGEYPVEYFVELTGSGVEIDAASGKATKVWLEEPKSRWFTTTPHLATNAPGGGRFRWRVKAKNRLGESDWSEYREFEF
jgi:hypothetical protein